MRTILRPRRGIQTLIRTVNGVTHSGHRRSTLRRKRSRTRCPRTAGHHQHQARPTKKPPHWAANRVTHVVLRYCFPCATTNLTVETLLATSLRAARPVSSSLGTSRIRLRFPAAVPARPETLPRFARKPRRSLRLRAGSRSDPSHLPASIPSNSTVPKPSSAPGGLPPHSE